MSAGSRKAGSAGLRRASVELLAVRRGTLLAQLIFVARGDDLPLRCCRGVDTLSAAGLSAELGDFMRFPRPALVSGFLGIVPSEYTSDLKPRQGAITKADPGATACCSSKPAHHYRRKPATGPTLARRH